MKIRYDIDAGRVLLKNNNPVFVFDRIAKYISPVDADILAHRIANALNHMEMIRQKKVGK